MFERMQPRRERVLRFAWRDRERGARDHLSAIDLEGDAMDRRAAPSEAGGEGVVDRMGTTQRRDARAIGHRCTSSRRGSSGRKAGWMLSVSGKRARNAAGSTCIQPSRARGRGAVRKRGDDGFVVRGARLGAPVPGKRPRRNAEALRPLQRVRPRPIAEQRGHLDRQRPLAVARCRDDGLEVRTVPRMQDGGAAPHPRRVTSHASTARAPASRS